MNRHAAVAALLLGVVSRVSGQTPSPHDMMDMGPKAAAPADSGRAGMGGEALGISMDRMGSGTSWIPDAVALPSRHLRAGRWMVMLHGFGFMQYITQEGPRGDDQLGSLNWGMIMASRPLAGGQFQARAMLSLDPATVSNRGYPLLLQSGESYRGEPLVDRQHPHDFLMEVGVLYERPVSPSVGVAVYAAPSGEPALGPVAFMHRPSAMDNPFAPLSHHWQDATHISFGVVTAGVFGRRWKLEGSVFNGREPDDRRWNIDRIRLDSYSGRVTINPGAQWSASAGYGYLKSPEALHPGESVRRFTASVLHGARLGSAGQWSSALVYGANSVSGEGKRSWSTLLETEAVPDRRNTLLARIEYVEKSAEELVLDLPAYGFGPGERFRVGSLSVGYIREVARARGITLGLGAMGTVNRVPASLQAVYGSRLPKGLALFLRVRPVFAGGMTAGQGMEGHQHQGNR